MKHLLSLESMGAETMEAILEGTGPVKARRGSEKTRPLEGQVWALIFSKSSTRTRVSFEVGIRELGGSTLFLNAGDLQLGRGEPIQDTARVLARMLHGAVIRTYNQSDVETFARYGGIPTVNALTDDEHPCQVLGDIFTFQEKQGPIAGKIVTFVGDGSCNVARSWACAAAKLGFELRVASPRTFFPEPFIDRLSKPEGAAAEWFSSQGDETLDSVRLTFPSGGKVFYTPDCRGAAAGAHLLYTDVWVSMGKEEESAERLRLLSGYQINQELAAQAAPHALVMHCLPAYRGKEIDEATFEAHSPTIFDQAENRLHVQKMILQWLVA